MNIQLFRAIRPSNVRSANRTKSKTLMLLTAITVLATLPISVGLSAQQKFTSIDVPGATFTDASGINPRGDIVGLYFDTSGNRHGFLLSNGTFTTIDVPVAIFTDPSAIDPQGDISGFYTDSSGNTHGFLLSK
jgi:probable HAF family extracellular repeat protein